MRVLFFILAVVFFIIAFYLKPASADSLVAWGGSFHVEDADFNETNPGLGYEYDYSRNVYFTAGGYWNSHRQVSTYAAVGYERSITPLTTAGVVAGPVTNFPTPVAAALTGSIGTQALNVKVVSVPTVVTAVQLRIGW